MISLTKRSHRKSHDHIELMSLLSFDTPTPPSQAPWVASASASWHWQYPAWVGYSYLQHVPTGV